MLTRPPWRLRWQAHPVTAVSCFHPILQIGKLRIPRGEAGCPRSPSVRGGIGTQGCLPREPVQFTVTLRNFKAVCCFMYMVRETWSRFQICMVSSPRQPRMNSSTVAYPGTVLAFPLWVLELASHCCGHLGGVTSLPGAQIPFWQEEGGSRLLVGWSWAMGVHVQGKGLSKLSGTTQPVPGVLF